VSADVAELERRVTDLRAFVHHASHDLQEPLRAVAGYSRLLVQHLGEATDPHSQYLLGQIMLATAEMSTLLKDLLDYATLAEKRWNWTRVHLADVLQRVRADLAREIEEAEARLERGDLGWVTGDPLALRLLLRCLLSNALKFRRGSHPLIEVGGDGSEFWVTDDGIGVPERYHQEVFEPFRRLHTLDEIPGKGLGLAMARRIVERYGPQARIWMESNPVFGVTVRFRLPHEG
jgi:light-regulated signal transduction histidine kinase (bacteriophytochrome)